MANVKAIATGNWSNTAIWDTGALPTASDDVYANGFTVTINQAITVLSIRTTSNTGIAAGGTFNMSTAYNCTSDVYAGATNCCNITCSGTVTWTGNINGSATVTIKYGMTVNNAGLNFILIGNCSSLIGDNSIGLAVTNALSLNITGNLYGSNINTNGVGLLISIAGSVNITGNIYGGGAGGYGLSYSNPGIIANINGNITGGNNANAVGLINSNTGTINITGTATGGIVSGATGANNASTGTLTCTTATASSTVNVLAVGVNGANTGGLTRVKNIVFGSAGQVPVSGFIKFDNGNENTATLLKQSGSTVVISDPLNVSNLMPVTTNVRSGIVFNNGAQTGTLIVPSPSNVVKDIATDNTVGTYSTTPTLIATEILTKLLSATDFNISGSFGKLIKDNLNATVSSRLSTAGYTAPPTVANIEASTILAKEATLAVIYEGVKKASLLIPVV
jgi:hypothetical protein